MKLFFNWNPQQPFPKEIYTLLEQPISYNLLLSRNSALDKRSY